MSIKRELIDNRDGGFYYEFTPVCNLCGDELRIEHDFYDAVNAKKKADWKSRKTGDSWIDICTYCQEMGG